jgi:hypothetical protein
MRAARRSGDRPGATPLRRDAAPLRRRLAAVPAAALTPATYPTVTLTGQ